MNFPAGVCWRTCCDIFQYDKPFISPCRKIDLLVGAPLFMDRGSDGKLREVGQVYVYMGLGGFTFNSAIKLTGSEIYARYGSSICSLGDLNMDGYNGTSLTPLILFFAFVCCVVRNIRQVRTYMVICGHAHKQLSLSSLHYCATVIMTHELLSNGCTSK